MKSNHPLPHCSAKIICTIGPSSESEEQLTALMRAGMNVARFNFSHGSYEEHLARLHRIRRIAQTLNLPIAILQDLQGPKIRIGSFENGQVELVAGAPFTVTTEKVVGNVERVSTVYRGIVKDVKPGDMLLLDDGRIRLRVTQVSAPDVQTEVVVGGTLRDKKGINLPNVKVSIPSLTSKDREDLAFGMENEVDYIAVSFVRTATDIELVRATMQELDPDHANIPIIAKLEKPDALDNLSAIVDAADGVMVARGDLGVELGAHRVPSVQKKIIREANRQGKIVITATQMLESMIENPIPTRAEASDVANAIFDGTDAIMLSGETAVGHYPIETVQMMSSIALDAEQNYEWGSLSSRELTHTPDNTLALAQAAHAIASRQEVKAIAVLSRTGNSARVISKEHPAIPIFGFTSHPHVYRRMSLLWGVTPLLIPRAASVEEIVRAIETCLLERRLVSFGDEIIIMTGLPILHAQPANIVMLHTVTQPDPAQTHTDIMW